MSQGVPNQKTPLVSGIGNRDALDRARRDVDEVTGIMRDNINKAIERGESINDLDSRSQQLEADSQVFKTKSLAVRRRFCVGYYRMVFLIVVVVAAILGVIIWAATKK